MSKNKEQDLKDFRTIRTYLVTAVASAIAKATPDMEHRSFELDRKLDAMEEELLNALERR